MATFKLTIAEDTPLWERIGGLSAKARNAELYRLATTGLIAQGHFQSFNQYEKSGQLATTPCQNTRQPSSNSVPVDDTGGSFISVDLGKDLLFLIGN